MDGLLGEGLAVAEGCGAGWVRATTGAVLVPVGECNLLVFMVFITRILFSWMGRGQGSHLDKYQRIKPYQALVWIKFPTGLATCKFLESACKKFPSVDWIPDWLWKPASP
ncbi:hypothetical protein CCP4SC76_600049 [Gammaproteobacteria bacterium]